ncbi:MAG: lactonase family protein [Paenibacillaceae bacterium]|jgi:6-phosphogluconolactonase|nr:lactonase family protein [Paenibacillaceae bacterium]
MKVGNSPDSTQYKVIVGSYSSPEETGIHTFVFDGATGTLEYAGGTGGIGNPSFVTEELRDGQLFAVSEMSPEGAVVSYAIDEAAGVMIQTGRQSTRGNHPCHLHADPTGQWLLTVNYSGGSLCLYPILENGAVGPLSDQVFHHGSSVRADRQSSAHPHSIIPVPGSDLWLVPDLGMDRLFLYELDRPAGKLMLRSETVVEGGAGPRHAVFHPHLPVVYVTEELGSSVGVYHLNLAGLSLERKQQMSTLPSGWNGVSTAAEIRITRDGRYVYASNRGHDSIAAFRTGEDGSLVLIDTYSTLGRTPRHFNLDPSDRYLIAANQHSDGIVVFSVAENGTLTAVGGPVAVNKPTCIQFYRI